MGRVWRFGDNVSTDEIIPGRRNITTDEAELARYVFEHARPEFAGEARPGDVIVGGSNFGCGSSREHAALAIRAAGVRQIAAKSYASIFYRNCINTGIYPLKLLGEADIRDGDSVKVDVENFELATPRGAMYKLRPLPSFIMDIIKAGGLIPYLNENKTLKI